MAVCIKSTNSDSLMIDQSQPVYSVYELNKVAICSTHAALVPVLLFLQTVFKVPCVYVSIYRAYVHQI